MLHIEISILHLEIFLFSDSVFLYRFLPTNVECNYELKTFKRTLARTMSRTTSANRGRDVLRGVVSPGSTRSTQPTTARTLGQSTIQPRSCETAFKLGMRDIEVSAAPGYGEQEGGAGRGACCRPRLNRARVTRGHHCKT